MIPVPLAKTKKVVAKMMRYQFIDQDKAEQCVIRFTYTANQEVSDKNTKAP